ncbi:hypothetical protein [Pseudomonas sp. FP1740]|uniref:hypothetical protein n=1 Tax=Pseudomonas sp. FP1740 TaxID=2954078 RepID=UPI0027360A21|nr:hypothetical protein [Pseudomonas sp. FP1740]WLG47332.1 hypothetical protein PSH69_12280 [Pseudomonas sp. FP1740]
MSTIKGSTPKTTIKKILLWVLLLAITSYITSCIFISKQKSIAFEAINIGDTQGVVIGRLGMPSHVEKPSTLFTRYASHHCQHPCVERLWFENRLSFDIEAWSVELDEGGRVVKKAYWASP